MLPPFVRVALDLFPIVVRAASALLAWLATYAIHSTVLIAAAWGIASSPLGRRLRLTESPGLWRFALVGGMVSSTCLTAFAPVTGTWRFLSASAARADYQVFMRSDGRTGVEAAPTITTHVTLHPLWPIVVTVLWIVVASTGLLLLVLAHRRLVHPFASGEQGTNEFARNALAEIQRRAGIDRVVDLRVAPTLGSPVAIGRRLIGLPTRALEEFDLAQLETMLAHELAHLERRDGTWLLLSRVIEAVFFFQPLNRLARLRMVEASEFAADRWAVAVTAQPLTLARCLAHVAQWALSDRQTLAPAMVERKSSAFVERVRRLTIGRSEAPPSWFARASTIVAMGSLVLLAPRAAVGRAEVSGYASARRVMVLTHDATVDARVRAVTHDSSVVLLRVPDR